MRSVGNPSSCEACCCAVSKAFVQRGFAVVVMQPVHAASFTKMNTGIKALIAGIFALEQDVAKTADVKT